jgi:predicted RNA-binding Zn ribbon-like protein
MVTRRAAEIPLVGGDPALDLANTLDGPRHGEPTGDHLHDPEDLVAWAVRAGVLEAPVVAGADVLDRVRRLREPVDAVFRALAEGDQPDPRALAQLNELHVEALRHARLAPANEGVEYSWDPDDARRIPWTLAVAAVDLLRSGPLERLRACHDCRWLFLDTSRNASRRWCSMNECGARAKMRRYRARRATAGR